MPKKYPNPIVPGNMLASEFNRIYVRPFLETGHVDNHLVAPRDIPAFFNYILQSIDDSVHGDVEKHSRLLLTYYELPFSDKKTLFPMILTHFEFLYDDTLIQLLTSTHTTHANLLNQHPTIKIPLISFLMMRHADSALIAHLINLLDETCLYSERDLDKRPLSCAAMNHYDRIIEILNQKGMVDVPQFTPLAPHSPIEEDRLFALELVDPNHASFAQNLRLLRPSVQLFFTKLIACLNQDLPYLSIGPLQIPITDFMISTLISKLLNKHELLLPNIGTCQTVLTLLYNHPLHKKEAALKFANTLGATSADPLHRWFVEEVVNHDDFSGLDKKACEQCLFALTSTYQPKLTPAFEKLYTLLDASQRRCSFIYRLIPLAAVDYIAIVLRIAGKKIKVRIEDEDSLSLSNYTVQKLEKNQEGLKQGVMLRSGV